MDRRQNESPRRPSKHVSLLFFSNINGVPNVLEKHVNLFAIFMNSDSEPDSNSYCEHDARAHALTAKLTTALFYSNCC